MKYPMQGIAQSQIPYGWCSPELAGTYIRTAGIFRGRDRFRPDLELIVAFLQYPIWY
jgi:hypothetical protein